MGFSLGATLDDTAYHFNLRLRNYSNLVAQAYQGMDAGRAQDVNPPIEPPSEEYVARKQRQRERLCPILPAVGGCVKGKENFKPFVLENTRRYFLVLVPRVQSVPTHPLVGARLHGAQLNALGY